MKILIINLLLCALIFENAINQIETGKINQEKSFDQIFGQRWDERTEENIYRIDQMTYGENDAQNNQFGQNDQQFDQIVDENLKVKEEESEEMSTTDGDELCVLPMSTFIGQSCDDFSNAIDRKKREIVEKFHKIREKIKQMGKKYSTKEWQKIERKIAKKLGAKEMKIYKWKREFGMMIKKNYYSDEEKCKILKQFDQLYGKLKNKLNEKLKGKRTKCQIIIAKHLGIDIRTIYNWKKQLKAGNLVNNQKTDEKKREIIEKYLKIKNEFTQNGKHSRKEWKEFIGKIKQIFGVSHMPIEKWAEQLNIKQNISKKRKCLTISEKMVMMKQYYQLKKENKNLTDQKIAEYLKISTSSLTRFKVAFKEKGGDILNTTADGQ